jgi:hypothetical protein
VEAFGGDGGQEARLVAEVVAGGGMGDPGPPRQLPEAECLGPALGDLGQRRLEQHRPQVAVMVGALRRIGGSHDLSLTT